MQKSNITLQKAIQVWYFNYVCSITAETLKASCLSPSTQRGTVTVWWYILGPFHKGEIPWELV